MTCFIRLAVFSVMLLWMLAGCGLIGQPQVIVVTTTPAPTAVSLATIPSTPTERVVIVTATSAPLPTMAATDTTMPPTQTPIVVIVTATRAPQPVQTQPKPVSGNKYPAPVLSSPQNGASTPARCQTVMFSWSGPTLGANEWYVLEKAKQDHPNEWGGMADWTQSTSVVLNPTHRDSGGGCYYDFYDNYGSYLWRVRIVSGNKETHTITADISPASQSNSVVYGP